MATMRGILCKIQTCACQQESEDKTLLSSWDRKGLGYPWDDMWSSTIAPGGGMSGVAVQVNWVIWSFLRFENEHFWLGRSRESGLKSSGFHPPVFILPSNLLGPLFWVLSVPGLIVSPDSFWSWHVPLGILSSNRIPWDVIVGVCSCMEKCSSE